MNRFRNILRIVAPAVFAALLAVNFPKIRVENSLERWVPPSSPEIARYKDFLEQFGGSAMLMVAFHDPAGFESAEAQEALMDSWDGIKDLPGIDSVTAYPPPLFRLKRLPPRTISALLIKFTPPSYLNPNRPELLRAIRDLLRNVPLESHLAGTGVLHEAIDAETQKYILSFMGLGLAFLVGLLMFVLKSVRAFLMTVSVSAGGVATLLLAAAVFRIPLSMVTVILPVIVIFYGTSGSLHVLFHRGDFRKVVGPCSMAVLTTVLGFLTFWPSSIPLLKDFAVLGTAGIAGGFAWALLLFFPRRYSFEPRADIERFFRNFPVASRASVLAVFLALTAAMAPGILKLKADINSLDIISPSDPAVVDHRFIEQNVSRIFPLEYTVEIDRVDPVRLNSWMTAVFGLEEVDGVVSYLHFPPGERDRSHYVSADGRLGRITFLIPVLSTGRGIELVDRIGELAAAELAGLRPEANGHGVLYAVIAEDLRNAFISSLALAFSLIFLTMGLYLRDLRLFAASILPNLLPVAGIVGLMGWTGLTLNMATVPIGCLMLGILVDNTFHLLFWYRRTGGLKEAFREAAPGMVLTAAILSVGFSVFLFAAAPPLRYFGILSLAALITGLAGDCILLPVLVRILDRDKIGRGRENE